ncbi:MAG: branched-chain amino acid ABC transporter permease [Desulfosoma sp.]|uniref:branched-chain amino acid ABC transporter permease n=1 Tax=Desulfosoma sp. TaxID=2603217 RepID=UPI00404A365E
MTSREKAAFLALTIFLAAFPWLAGVSRSFSHYTDVMIFAGIFCLVTIGLSLLMGFAGQISLAQAAFFGIGAYGTGILTVHFRWNPWVALLAGAAAAAAVAWLVGKPALRLKGHYLAMATLGFGVIVHIVMNEEVDWTGGPSGFGGIPGLSFAGRKLSGDVAWFYLVWGIVLVVFLFTRHVLLSRIGRALRAIHDDEKAAEAMGVPVGTLKVQVFVYSAVSASIAGSLYAHYVSFLSPGSFDLMWSIRFVLMVVVGGMQSLWGALAGTVLLTFVGNEWLQVFADFEILVYGGILLLMALFVPQGLVLWLQGIVDRGHRIREPYSDGGS